MKYMGIIVTSHIMKNRKRSSGVLDGQKLSFGGVAGKTLARLEFVCPAVQFQVTSRSSRGHTRERAQVFDLYQDVFFDRCCQPECLIRDVAVILFDDPTGCLCVC